MKTLETLVNPFGKSESESPDNINKPILGRDKFIDFVLRRHKEVIEDAEAVCDIHQLPVATLSPAKIDVFLQRLIQENRLYADSGRYLSRLIYEAYKKGGNTEFSLHTGDTTIPLLCETLCGTTEKPITVNVLGNVGGFFAARSQNCTYIIEGYAGDLLAVDAHDCTFVLEKTPHLEYCNGWSRCTFKTHSEQVYKEMKELFEACDRPTDNLILLK